MDEMVRDKPIELGLAKQLREDEEFRKHFFRTRARKEIASQIRQLREKADLRQSDLAERCEMKQSAISRIEQADYSSWNYKTLLRVAEALNTRLRIIFEPVEESVRAYELEEASSTTRQRNRALQFFEAASTGKVSPFELRAHTDALFSLGPVQVRAYGAHAESFGERSYIELPSRGMGGTRPVHSSPEDTDAAYAA